MYGRYKIVDSKLNYPGPGQYVAFSEFGIYESKYAHTEPDNQQREKEQGSQEEKPKKEQKPAEPNPTRAEPKQEVSKEENKPNNTNPSQPNVETTAP